MIKTRFASGCMASLKNASLVRSCLFGAAAFLLSLLFVGGGAGCKVDSTPPNTTHKDMSMVGVDLATDPCSEKCENPDAKCCNGDACIDTKTNSTHCGGCNMPCRTREACSNGLCVCSGGGHDDICTKDELCCSDGCHNTQTDATNCGGCGLTCKTGETCQDSACKCGPAGTTCKTGQICCSSGCSDLQSDPNNCGTCGRVCPKGMCANGLCDGECPTPCAFPTKCCNGICADLANDPKNCRDCGRDCSVISKWKPPTCLGFICLGEPGADMGGIVDMSTSD